MPTHRGVVTGIGELAPSVVQITVSLTQHDFTFRPGQWVHFRFPEGVSRAYTIASAPERQDTLELCVRVGSGRGGTALQHLEAGAEVSIEGPHGSFLLPDGDQAVVFLAGDTGIAPVRSIVLHMLAENDPRAITVLYEPDHRHILYAADFDPLARTGTIVHESGNIEALIARNRRALSNATVMVVGFDTFLDRCRKAVEDMGLDSAAMISESFGPEP